MCIIVKCIIEIKLTTINSRVLFEAWIIMETRFWLGTGTKMWWR